VQEVFKSNGAHCTVSELTVVHPTVVSGVEVDGKVYRRRGKTPFKPGAEYVLFLVWHDAYKAFASQFGPASFYELSGEGSVRVDDSNALSQRWSGRPPNELLEALRSM
jgi:hypothetical protein